MRRATLILLFVTAASAHAQDPPNMQEAMDKWMATIKPGEMHEKLAPLVGEWETTMKTYFAGPDGPAQETKGKATKKWILGKRFVMQEFQGEFPMPSSSGEIKMTPYEGIGLLGYDNYRKLFVHTWVDSLSTAMIRTTGTMPPSGALNLYGEMDEPMMSMTGRTVRFETKIENDDAHVFTIYDLAVGPEYKVIEITYRRKK